MMKIRIRAESVRLSLYVPGFWILGRPFLYRLLNRFPLSVGFSKELNRERKAAVKQLLKRCKKRYRGLPLVEVEGSDGSYVSIHL